MTILYEIGDSLYINLTNNCPCACVFCLRSEGKGAEEAYGVNSLWLDHDPSLEEIFTDFKNYDLNKYKEFVFCGYGEPLERLDIVIEVAKYIRANSNITIRLNTNGLADLIHQKETAPLLKGLIDAVSISLNAPSAESYLKVARPVFGIQSFDALLKFAEGCKKSIGDVTFSLVDVITSDEIQASQKLADQMNIKLRIRQFID